jgi:acyl carrier protein
MWEEGIATRIRQVIASTAELKVEPTTLSAGDDLYAAGLKSLATVRLMCALEEEFGIEFPDSVLNREAFATIQRIASIIGQLLGVGAVASGTAQR